MLQFDEVERVINWLSSVYLVLLVYVHNFVRTVQCRRNIRLVYHRCSACTIVACAVFDTQGHELFAKTYSINN